MLVRKSLSFYLILFGEWSDLIFISEMFAFCDRIHIFIKGFFVKKSRGRK